MKTSVAPVREREAESVGPMPSLDLPELAPPAALGGSRGESLGPAAAPSRATFLRSFGHAWDGVVYALRTQRNARVHLAAAVCALALGVALHISSVEFALIMLAIMAVLVAEFFNTVAEAIVDMVTAEYHPLARVAKDVAAGAVLLCALFAVAIGLLVFGPHLWPLLTHLVAR